MYYIACFTKHNVGMILFFQAYKTEAIFLNLVLKTLIVFHCCAISVIFPECALPITLTRVFLLTCTAQFSGCAMHRGPSPSFFLPIASGNSLTLSLLLIGVVERLPKFSPQRGDIFA